MDFMRLLKSIEELIYELVTWLLFYPLTLWRIVRHPMAMLAYAERELTDKEQGQYDDALGPPLMLLLTLVLLHVVELTLTRPASLPGFLADDRNALLFRAISFSILPLVFALTSMRGKATRINRSTLKPAFYSQSYATIPFILMVSLGLQVLQGQGGTSIGMGAGLVAMAAGFLWFVAVQTAWLARRLGMAKTRAFLLAVGTLLVSLGLISLVAVIGSLAAMGSSGPAVTGS